MFQIIWDYVSPLQHLHAVSPVAAMRTHCNRLSGSRFPSDLSRVLCLQHSVAPRAVLKPKGQPHHVWSRVWPMHRHGQSCTCGCGLRVVTINCQRVVITNRRWFASEPPVSISVDVHTTTQGQCGETMGWGGGGGLNGLATKKGPGIRHTEQPGLPLATAQVDWRTRDLHAVDWGAGMRGMPRGRSSTCE